MRFKKKKKNTAHSGSDGGRNETTHYRQKYFHVKNAKLFSGICHKIISVY